MHRNNGFFSGIVKDLTFFPKSDHLLTSLLALIPLYNLITAGAKVFPVLEYVIITFPTLIHLHSPFLLSAL